MIRRYQTRYGYNIFHSNEHSVSLALVEEIKQALLNHDFKFLLNATAYLIILFSSARELVRSCVLLSTTYNEFPKKIIDMILVRIERKSSLIESPVFVPLSIERTMYYMSNELWREAANCSVKHLDRNNIVNSPLLKTYAAITHYILFQRERLLESEQLKKGMKIGQSNTHQLQVKDTLNYFEGIYGNKGVWDVPLYLHMKLLVEEKNDFTGALSIARENAHANKYDINALVTLAEFYILLSNYESDLYNKEQLIDTLIRIQSIDPSNYLMTVLCQEYGISEETTNFIISVAMAFLDYPCNRGEHLMWECLYGALTELSCDEFELFVATEWEHRRLWWTQLHFDTSELKDNFHSNIMLYCYKALAIHTLSADNTNQYSVTAKYLLGQTTGADYSLECVANLNSLGISDSVNVHTEEEECHFVLDFSKDLTEDCEEIGLSEDVELEPVPLAKHTKFFVQEDLAAYCYISDQCLVRQEIERLFFLRRLKANGPPRGVHEREDSSEDQCLSFESDSGYLH